MPYPMGNVVKCAYCDAEIPKENIERLHDTGWTWGRRWTVVPCGPRCCASENDVRHACPSELCQAKLKVWTVS